MSIDRIKGTNIFKRTLGSSRLGTQEDLVNRLNVSFFNARSKSEKLLTRIAAKLPDLTIHDISHIDALWEVADVVIGSEYPVNPLEAYILGCAFLIHDAALCLEAYEGGVEELRDSIEWKDLYMSCDWTTDAEKKIEYADFGAMRVLHAQQAEKILSIGWEDVETGEVNYLIDDFSIRKHFGKIIGRIASSHHWDIEKVKAQFSTSINSLPEFPSEWKINQFKLACIVRCADAGHLTSERAPDFLFALLKREGVSFDHWRAQNAIGNVSISKENGENKLLFTSTINFKESAAPAWYVLYDALKVVDKEIKNCNQYLIDRPECLPFYAKGVVGVSTPEKLVDYIGVEGWSPSNVEIHVSNVKNLIKTLGGTMLYGSNSDEFTVVIRELIQNSRDAIKAREEMSESFEGKIRITILEDTDDIEILVQDNGIGMSSRVITGPLLEFGTSFWSSHLVRSEFPGLSSSGFVPVGKFGIGFYSIFMLGNYVEVHSRLWNEGVSNSTTIKFPDGLSLRPIIKRGVSELSTMNYATTVRLKVGKDKFKNIHEREVVVNQTESHNYKVPIGDYLSALCVGLDVDVELKIQDEEIKEVHKDVNKPYLDVETWLNKISFSVYNPNVENETYIKHNFNRLRSLKDKDGRIMGFAAISTILDSQPRNLSNVTVGGLSSNVIGNSRNDLIGFINTKANSAKRDPDYNYYKGLESIHIWGAEQIDILEESNINPFEKFSACSSLSALGIDPIRLLVIPYVTEEGNLNVVDKSRVIGLLQKKNIGFVYSSTLSNHADTYQSLKGDSDTVLFKPFLLGSFLNIELNGKEPSVENSILGCLHRYLVSEGYTPTYREAKNVGTGGLNQKLHLRILSIK